MTVSLSPQNNHHSTNQQVAILGILIIGLIMGIVRFNDIPIGSFFDDAHYLVLAKSLATGNGYRLINYPHLPVENAFPFGWPLLLTPLAFAFPNNFLLPKLLVFTLWFGGILLAYRLFSKQLPSPYSQIFLALIGWNPQLVGMAGTAMSESAYLFFSLLTLNLLQMWQDQKGKRPFLLLSLLLLAAIYTMLVRTIGIALLGAVLIMLLVSLKKQHRTYLFIGGGILLLILVPLTWFNISNGGSFIFSSLYTQHIIYVTNNLGTFLRFWEHGTAVSYETIANAVVPIFGSQIITDLLSLSVMHTLGIAVLLIIAIGWGISLPKMPAQATYVLLYFAIFYVWIVYIDKVQPRIALPLIPFFTFYIVQAISKGAHWLLHANANKAQHVSIALLSGLLVVLVLHNLYVWQRPTRDRFIDMSVGTTWIKNNSPTDALVLTANAVPDYLYMLRQTIDYPHNGVDYAQVIESNGVDYILIHPLLESSSEPRQLNSRVSTLLTYLKAHPDQYTVAFQKPAQNVWVFQVK
ncbi:MAG: hypothetical protein GY805_36085 [Chloroflexi bacterium]|nr:hypothetical protein [Chloroflexota bacterium]